MFTLTFTKDELQRVPKAHRTFYLMLGQSVNEVAMLQTLLVRAMHGAKEPRAVMETSLGLMFFLMRNICGRIYEARETINSKDNGKLLDDLLQHLPPTSTGQKIVDEALAGKSALNKLIGSKNSLISRVRNKLAYHLDQDIIETSFDKMPDDYSLADFHTGQHGTTFFGAADTVAALAVSALIGEGDVLAGANALFEEALKAIEHLQAFSTGYLLAFYIAYFGEDRFDEAEHYTLRNLPEAGRSSVGFFMASTRGSAEGA